MPEADYQFRPQGAPAEVRTFGQMIAHLVAANYSICAAAKPETGAEALGQRQGNAAEGQSRQQASRTPSPTAIPPLRRAHRRQRGRDDQKFLARTTRSAIARAENQLTFNLAHNNEHYGNLVTYLRLKGLVPPSSEGR